MPATDGLIVVINRTAADAENIKELIEFMDAPEVCIATPSEWRRNIGTSRLDAVFVGPDLSDGEIRTVVGEIGDLNPNIPIVMLHAGDETG